MKNIKSRIFGFLYALALTAFTGYVLLDTFVIERVYTVVAASPRTIAAEAPEKTKGALQASAENQSANDAAGLEFEENQKADGAADLASAENQSTNDAAGLESAENQRADDAANPESAKNQTAATDSALSTAQNQNTAESQAAEATEDQNTAESEGRSSFITDLTYEDENISVVIREFREYDTTIYAADVRVSSPEYLKTALAKGAYGRNITQTTSEMAAENGAILAVNGDYYGAQERGYVLRNGQLLRNTAVEDKEDLVIFQDGSFSIINESEVSAEALLDAGAQQILSFGPALVADGGIAVSETEEVGRAKASNPRTAIGIIDELHYLFVVSDGRTDESAGLSLYQLAKLMEEMGAKTAYNLDGGGSSSLVFNGEVINNPASGRNHSKERSVSDIVYIGY